VLGIVGRQIYNFWVVSKHWVLSLDQGLQAIYETEICVGKTDGDMELLKRIHVTHDGFILTSKGPRSPFSQKPLKIAISAAFIQQKKKKLFLESNRRILYMTFLGSCGKNFMNFDRTDWKIFALKLEKQVF